MNSVPPCEDPATPTLRRILTFWPLVFYGLGVIVGAGIYVALGAVIARAHEAAPWSFLVSGLAAGLTGLCYAELAGRFPDAAGAASYVRHGFGSDRLAVLTGTATTLAVVVAAASIARGSVQYLRELIPLPEGALTAFLVTAFTLLAASDVRTAVGLAAGAGALEVAGLLAAIAAGLVSAPAYHIGGMLPSTFEAWQGVLGGSFIAFFAFVGFETLANMAEEVKEPRRTVPLGIVGAVTLSTILYVAVAVATILADSTGANPLLELFEGRLRLAFALAGFVAVANGVIVQIVMLARLFYGMARHGQLPAFLGRVSPITRTPVSATLIAGALVLMAGLALPFESLLVVTNVVTLLVFALVDISLWRLHDQGPSASGGFVAGRWVPPAAAVTALGMIAAEFVR